jgi:hypothetical protein
MGEIYLAQHPRLPRRDALKVLPAEVTDDTDYRERFNREAVTATGTPAYCAHLSSTGSTIWSLYPGEVSSPTVTPDPTDQVCPPETETPVRVCMEQTQQTRIRCLMDIRRSNQAGSPTP